MAMIAAPDPRLDGARLKIKRAKIHLDAIKSEVLRVTNPDAYSVIVNTNSEERKHTWTIAGLQPLDEMFPLWIGDCLHNIRSAFDHIAFELIKLRGLTPGKRTMFPLLADAPSQPVFIMPAPGPHADAMDIVDDIQPYKTGGKGEPLAILQDLDIIDKHREVLATVAAVVMPYFGCPQGVTVIDTFASGGPVVDGQVVMWALIDKSQPKGHLDGHIGLTVKLSEGLIPGSLHMTSPVDDLIERLITEVEFDILPRFDAFLAAHP